MVSSLRHTVFKNFGKIDYLHYFRKMIKDYETKKWDFDIRTIVKNVKVENLEKAMQDKEYGKEN